MNMGLLPEGGRLDTGKVNIKSLDAYTRKGCIFSEGLYTEKGLSTLLLSQMSGIHG